MSEKYYIETSNDGCLKVIIALLSGSWTVRNWQWYADAGQVLINVNGSTDASTAPYAQNNGFAPLTLEGLADLVLEARESE